MNAEIISMLSFALEIAELDESALHLHRLDEGDPERLALLEEDARRKAVERNRMLQRYGVDNILADVVERLESIEKKLDGGMAAIRAADPQYGRE